MEQEAKEKRGFMKRAHVLFGGGLILGIIRALGMYGVVEIPTWADSLVTLAAVAIILLWMKYFNDLCKAMGRRFGWLLGLLMFIPQVGLFVVYGVALASASRYNKSQSMPR